MAKCPAAAARMRSIAAALVAASCCACAHAREVSSISEPGGEPNGAASTLRENHDPPPPRLEVQVGYATWYGQRFAGRRTASGERFDPRAADLLGGHVLRRSGDDLRRRGR